MRRERVAMSLEIEVTVRPHLSGLTASVVRLIGVLDGHTSESAQKAFAILALDRPQTVIIDLERLRFLDSRGISVLLAARLELTKGGSNVFLTNPQRPIRRVLDVVRALPSIAVFGSMDELDAYLAGVQERARRERG